MLLLIAARGIHDTKQEAPKLEVAVGHTHTQTAHIMRACAHTRRDHTYCNRRHKCHRHHAQYGKTGTRRETGRVDIEKEADGEGERRRETVRETEREREVRSGVLKKRERERVRVRE